MGKYDEIILEKMKKTERMKNCIVRVVDGTIYYMKIDDFVKICGDTTIREMRNGSNKGWCDIKPLNDLCEWYGEDFLKEVFSDEK